MRARGYSWVDPQQLHKTGRDLSGLDFTRHLLEAGEQGRMPIAATLGFRLAEVAEGYVVFVGEPAEHLYNPIGVVHGGVAATLLDSGR
ncbi:MAG TPA: PaaI family thioesterase [Pseudonocardiaceae bacterium]|jgi:acyl-coenzyme A thioesterase PaaI-like protein